MYSKAVDDLTKLQIQLDTDLNTAEFEENKLNQIAIRIVHYKNSLRNLETFFISSNAEENSERRKKYNEFKRKSNDYTEKVNGIRKNITEQNAMSHSMGELEETEFNENNVQTEGNEFVQRNTSRLDEYIFTAIDSIDQLKRQRVYIDNTRERIKASLYNIGLNSALVEKISSRYLSDYSFFWAGVILIIILIVVIRFVF